MRIYLTMARPRLNILDLTMIVVGLVIGMGIFRTASDASKAALTPAIYFGAWIFGGLVALCGALTYAEIGSRYPVTGGYYKIFSYAYHPSVAFALNCSILISNAAAISGVSLIGAQYITGVFAGQSPSWVMQIVAISAIMVFYGVNLAGLRMSARTQTLLMLVKILMLVLLISALFFPSAYQEDNIPVFQSTGEGWGAVLASFGLTLVAVSFTYGGYQQTINFGSEVNDARRNIPKSIFFGLAIIITLYLLVNISYYLVIGFRQMSASDLPVAHVVASRLLGSGGGDAFSLLLFLSVLAYVNVSLLSNPRVMFAMSEDGVLPQAFRRVSVSRGVFTVSLTAFACVAILVVFFAGTFERILSFSIFLDSFGMALSAATIFILRRRTAHLNHAGIYRMRLFPYLPLLFIGTYIFVCTIIIIHSPMIALTGICVMTGFLLLYFFIRTKTANR